MGKLYNGSATFMELMPILGMSEGALVTHLYKLKAVGYITSKKSLIGPKQKPCSRYRITSKGKEALQAHCREVLDISNGVISNTKQDSV